MPDRVLAALDHLTQSLERFRAAYEAWLRSEGAGVEERERLLAALTEAERRLDAARAALAAVQESA